MTVDLGGDNDIAVGQAIHKNNGSVGIKIIDELSVIFSFDSIFLFKLNDIAEDRIVVDVVCIDLIVLNT